jgi:hypothetical protein
MNLLISRLVSERFHRDDEGRPLREGRTPKELLRPDDIEYKTCPYAGSRHQHANPMNVSALRQTSAHWDPIIDALVQLRIAYAKRKSYGPDVMDVWRVSQLGSALPWFYIFRDGTTPAHAAALSKATLGMGIFAQKLLAKMLVERWLPPPLTSATMLELAEASGTLIGASEVCSGPDKMLLRFFDGYHDEPRVIEGAESIKSIDAIITFGAHYTNFKLALWIYFLARRFLYADAGLRDLMAAPVEPPDFFVLEPGNLAAIPRPMRAAWITSLASMIVPFAPDGSDTSLRDAVIELAVAMAAPVDEAHDVTVATYARIDAIFARIVDTVEGGFRRALGLEPAPKTDAASRDGLILVSPRDAFIALAPQTYASFAVP